MKKYLLVSAVLISGCSFTGSGFGGGSNNASRIDPTPPSNLPPASYSNMEFVDTRGCNYIRTEYEGNVTWVPRVTLNGSHICGGPQAAQYSVGGGVADIHGTLTQEAPAPASAPVAVAASAPAEPAQVATDRPVGGVQFGNLFNSMSGKVSDGFALITGVPEEVKQVPGSDKVYELTAVEATPAPAPQPAPVASAPAPVEVVEAPVVVATPEPVVVATPAPVAAPAPQPQPQAQPRKLSGNVMSVLIGTPASSATIKQLEALGYRIVARQGGTFVIPKAGENPMALKRELDQMGLSRTLVVGVAF